MSGTPKCENPSPPSDLEGDAKEAPRRGPRARDLRPSLHQPCGAAPRGWDAPGTSARERHWTAPPLQLPRAGGPARGVEFRRRPHLRPQGACGQVRVRVRAGSGPGVGLRVPVTATVTMALGNAFLPSSGRPVEVSQAARPGALGPVRIGSGTGSEEMTRRPVPCRNRLIHRPKFSVGPRLSPGPRPATGALWRPQLSFPRRAACSSGVSAPGRSSVWAGRRKSAGPG